MFHNQRNCSSGNEVLPVKSREKLYVNMRVIMNLALNKLKGKLATSFHEILVTLEFCEFEEAIFREKITVKNSVRTARLLTHVFRATL